ncbi:MAG: hypothetical protein ACFFF4_16885 [Candidatus Thorarchaeota archaeon]
MDLKSGIALVILIATWLASILGIVAFNIAIGLSVWTWLIATSWYTVQFCSKSDQDSRKTIFEGDIV